GLPRPWSPKSSARKKASSASNQQRRADRGHGGRAGADRTASLSQLPRNLPRMSRFVGTATVRRRCLDQEGRPGGRSLALRISKSEPRSSITLGALDAADAAQDVLPSASPVARRPAFRASPRRESNS